MMDENQAITILKKVVAATEKEKIEWIQFAENAFSTTISDLTIQLTKSGHGTHYFEISTPDDIVISSLKEVLFETSEHDSDLQNLYNIVFRQIYHIDKNLNDLSSSLDDLLKD